MHSLSFQKAGRIVVCLALIVVGFGIQPAKAAVQPIKIVVDNREVASDSSPVVIADRTYVPLRVISENLGCKVEWRPDTGHIVINQHTTSTPTLSKAAAGEIPILIDGQRLVIPADYGKAFVNSQYRMMVPLRAVSEGLDCQVEWLQSNYTVRIQSKIVSADQQLLIDLARYQTNLKLVDGSVINSAELTNNSASNYSAAQLDAFKTYLDQISKYPLMVSLPNGQMVKTADLSIMGNSYLTAAQLKQWISNETPRIKADMADEGLPFETIPDLAELYIKIGAKYGIRGDIAFCQAAKETRYWQFTGQVQAWQNNYCGLSAIGSPMMGTESLRGADPTKVSFQAGVHGAIFTTRAAGVEAHIQHLYAYASKNALPTGQVLLDPRYSLVSRGIGPTWLGLNARWAVPGTTYGQSILIDYWSKAVATAGS
jgi:hypothetical protein